MIRGVSMLALAMIAAGAVWSQDEKKKSKEDEQRESIDAMAGETLDALFEKAEKAKDMYEQAMGYAVFENVKVSLGISGGGGRGVAVAKASGHRTYMRMGTVGLNLGLGGQKYKVIFLFQDEEVFRHFVEKGWQAGADANAVAGPVGANAAATFNNGLAVYQLTDAGLMLQVDISGTKYWKNEKLNSKE